MIPQPSIAGATRFDRIQRACAAAISATNKREATILISLGLLYIAVVFAQSCVKVLWFDELLTVYIAKLSSARAIWNALSAGADPNPPLSHLLTIWSMRLFGVNQIAARLPAIVAGAIAIFSLFAFLRRRLPLAYAALGTLFFMCTAAFDYTYEARSYAWMLAFSILTLLLWRATVEGKRRRISAALLALALAAGISSNYFAVLAFFPIAAGELVRNLRERRVQFRVWIALAAGALPLIAYLPLIRSGMAIFAPHAWNKPHIGLIGKSYTEMVEVIVWPALALIAVWLIVYARGVRSARPAQKQVQRQRKHILPAHEVVAVIVLICYPLLGYGIAVARAGMFSPRFVAPVAYGFAIAFAVIAYRLFARNGAVTAALVALCFCWFVARESVCGYWFMEQRQALFHLRDRLPASDTIVVSDSLLVLPLYYYSPAEVRARLVFPVDFDAIVRYKKEDSPEQNLWAGRNDVFPVRVMQLSALQHSTNEYLIVTSEKNWLLQELAAEGAPAEHLPIDPGAKNVGVFTPICHGEPFYYTTGYRTDTRRALASTLQSR